MTSKWPVGPKRNSSTDPASKKSKPSQLEGERIQKILARAGVGSRREIERWIEAGKFKVNGLKAKLGDRLKEGDKLKLNGRIVNWEKYELQPSRVLIYYKPTGEIVSRRDKEGRPVIFTQLPRLAQGRWISVGRLDINSQGLIMVTNNGELAHRLMHPSSELEREYAVRILGKVNDSMVHQLTKGVMLDDGEARFEAIQPAGGEGANKWFKVVVKEGRNRLVRRLWDTQGAVVSRLIRIRFGNIILPEHLKPRTFHELTAKEVATLMQSVGLKSEIEWKRR